MKSTIFMQLMRRDFTAFMRSYPPKIFDTVMLLLTNLVVFGYFMPSIGLPTSYGAFILVGAIASFGLFDTFGKVGELILDIEGDKSITYPLSMPIPSSFVFLQMICKWAMTTFLISCPLIFIGKLILWNHFSLMEINWLKFILMFPTTCFFFGAFSLWLTSIIYKMDSLTSLYMRYINVMFMFGGYFFTWKNISEAYPTLAYILLFNPMTYVMEGMRAASLEPKEYLNFWACLLALWSFSLLLSWLGISRLKKRLDCI